VNSTKKKKQSSIKLALCMTSFVHCNIRRFSTLQNLVLSFSYCPLIHLEKLPLLSSGFSDKVQFPLPLAEIHIALSRPFPLFFPQTAENTIQNDDDSAVHEPNLSGNDSL